MRMLITAILFTAMTVASAYAGPAEGEAVFQSKCKACHSFGKTVMGPDLEGISKRANPEWLKKWLTDTAGTFDGNDPYTAEMKARSKAKAKPRHKTKALSEAEVADVVSFLMTK